ncbi:MAG: hypothetical protein HC924_18925 [Synechococcaceae cyanobacterium SM2_3_2]|nr:hypothetical protein [Synechococcaceae cyanobacterium SM2_3_2]
MEFLGYLILSIIFLLVFIFLWGVISTLHYTLALPIKRLFDRRLSTFTREEIKLWLPVGYIVNGILVSLVIFFALTSRSEAFNFVLIFHFFALFFSLGRLAEGQGHPLQGVTEEEAAPPRLMKDSTSRGALLSYDHIHEMEMEYRDSLGLRSHDYDDNTADRDWDFDSDRGFYDSDNDY